MTVHFIGTLLRERYRVDAQIGSGRMAQVYRGHDVLLDRAVAIKLLTGGDEPTRARFVNEARAMANLNHANIIAIYDFGEFEHYSYIVMEYAANGSLEHHPGAQFSFTDLQTIFLAIVSALILAHKRNIVHRDLKPGNVLITDDHIAKVADFGLSRRISDLPTTGTPGEIVGTVAYLPPEIFLGQANDGRGDLYSLGVMLYEAFTGRLPFTSDGGDIVAVIYAHVNDVPVPPRKLDGRIPPLLEALILRLLAKDPAARYASAVDVHLVLASLSLTTDTRVIEAMPQPVEARTPIEPVLREAVDRVLEPQRSTKAAFGKILNALLASRRKAFREAVNLYDDALNELHGLKNEHEYIKGALSMGDCLLALLRRDFEQTERSMVAATLQHLEDAKTYARQRNQSREVQALQSLLGEIERYAHH